MSRILRRTRETYPQNRSRKRRGEDDGGERFPHPRGKFAWISWIGGTPLCTCF
ncbi:hypothetical protein PUN28_004925 [Cardiocondyla obscurior]|uniref:Uncharacterized protein n=1 Tax=Cardiocondyla obscurior TaxID=286306 RepID=A0AAW2GHT0_9HYME